MTLTTSELNKDLVLVGGGHAHALALRMLAMQPVPGLRLTLVSLSSHTPYSGMLPGLIAGHYRFEQTHIDLARFCQWAGVRFIAAEVTGINAEAGCIALRDRPPIHYDILSIDTGSAPELASVPGAERHTTPVKPVHQFWQRWQGLAQQLEAPGRDTHIAVVGGGAGGVELVLAMAHKLRGKSVRFSLICGGPEILPNYNLPARSAVLKTLARYGISLRVNARVERVEDTGLYLAGGEEIAVEQTFWCTAAAAAAWIADCGLPTVDGGFLSLRDTLQVFGHDNIFAAGDVATQVNHPRPKAGVYAVRQGTVLAANLAAFATGAPLQRHRPQQRFLSLLSLGGKRAVADKSLFFASGSWVWRWKNHIDRKFMRLFEDLPTISMNMPPDSEAAAEQPQMPCGGCGAKVPQSALESTLVQLATHYPQHCHTGPAKDAVKVESGERELWQSVDVLRPLVADPYLMGRITALHALSDLHASALQPHSAQALVTLPFARPPLLQRELFQLLDGALAEFQREGCVLLGGHSMMGSEQTLGFVVNGHSPAPTSGEPLQKRGLQVGDHLLLTKALGIGVLFAAHMQLKLDSRFLDNAISQMLISNARAGQLAVASGASACTDITGFGLVGHLLEMLAPDQAATLLVESVPRLPGADTQITNGVRSTGYMADLAAATAKGPNQRVAGSPIFQSLFDPQTGGGLLIGVAPERSEVLRWELVTAGYPYSTVIGKVVATGSSDFSRKIRLLENSVQ